MNIRDISSYDSNINFSTYDGFIIRCVRTGGGLDTNLENNVQNAKNAGKPFGLYIFVNFKRDIQTQINAINEQVAKYGPTLRTSIDIEQDTYDNKVIPANINDIAHACLNGVPNSIIYCNVDMYTNYLDNSFGNTYLWLAQYGVSAPRSFKNIIRIGWQYQGTPIDVSTFDDRVYIPVIAPPVIIPPVVVIPEPVIISPVIVVVPETVIEPVSVVVPEPIIIPEPVIAPIAEPPVESVPIPEPIIEVKLQEPKTLIELLLELFDIFIRFLKRNKNSKGNDKWNR